jgi:hypothetical protein|tara:strand:- start:2677 stop:3828 length:1152 start_codon:yes stop_codon:yes gene_type:complete
MASTYSTDLKIQLMATGENSGTWGTITNTNLGTTLEEAICRSVDVSFSGASLTLSANNSNGAQSFRNLRLNLTGTGSAGISLTVPDIEKNYIVKNALSTDVDIKNSSGSDVTVPAGKTTLVYSTGSGVVDVVNSLASLVVESTFDAGGNGSVGGTFVITGDTTVSSNASVSGTLNVGSNTSVGGTFKVGSSAVITGNLTVGGENINTFINGDLVVASGMAVGSVATFSSNVTLGAVSNAVTSVNSQVEFNNNLREKTFLNTTSATGTFNYSLLSGGILLNQSSAASNFQLNLIGDGSTTLNEMMATGETTTFAMLNTNGSSAYYVTSILLDGTTASPIYWQGGTKPSSGNASSIDSYLISVTKTGSAQYTTLASLTQFGLDNY